MTELRGYSASISKYTGVTDQQTLNEIEDFMRDEYRTLDHLSPQQFARCAKECWQTVQFMRTPDGQEYAAQMMADVMSQAA